MKGQLHSIQTLGTLDGPGLRTVVFLQGCPLQCKFCHSVDTTPYSGGTNITPEQLFERVMKNEPYWRTLSYYNDETDSVVGGVTITGGEPTAQPLFLLEFLKLLKSENVHIALDTSLFTSKKTLDSLLPYVDLWMISLKHMDSIKHQELVGKPNEQIIENLIYLDKLIEETDDIESKIRIRFVLIPGVTDESNHLRQLGSFTSRIKNLEVFELLPYVTLGKFKWIELFGKYPLEGVPEAGDVDIQRFLDIISVNNLEVLY
jgi:pyruvate formate lyase activating enzyme